MRVEYACSVPFLAGVNGCLIQRSPLPSRQHAGQRRADGLNVCDSRLDIVSIRLLLASCSPTLTASVNLRRPGTATAQPVLIFNIGNVWSRPVNADRDAVRGALSQRILVRS